MDKQRSRKHEPLPTRLPSMYNKGKNQKHTECSTDVKLIPLAYNSQITTTFGQSL